jgi:hypothetical protein
LLHPRQGFGEGGFLGGAPNETVINNFYDLPTDDLSDDSSLDDSGLDDPDEII